MPDQFSYVSHLSCSECYAEFSSDEVQTFCQNCQAPLLANYDLVHLKKDITPSILAFRGRGMWRWHELLPIKNKNNIITLGEGDSPLLKSTYFAEEQKFKNIYIKDESQNPTGTFKARGLSAAISAACELGITKVIIPTAGNAGGAMAAYAAHGKLKAKIYMPIDTPAANLIECQYTGADVVLVDGLISDAALKVQADAAQEGWFDLSTFKEPYRTEGKKIMGYELAESFNWELPDVIIYPTGGGTGLVGMWKAFEELEALGWLNSTKKPRMVVVQSKGCAPFVDAFEKKLNHCTFWKNASTLASGLRVPKSFADKLLLRILYASNGIAVAISESEITDSWREFSAREGIFVAPEGAATWAALKMLINQGWVSPDEKVVLFNTGSGLKYLDKIKYN